MNQNREYQLKIYFSCLWPRCCVAKKRQTWANLSVLYWHHILMRKVWLIGLNSSKWTDFELRVTTLCFCRIFWWHFLNLLSFCLLCDIRFILCCTSEKRVSQNNDKRISVQLSHAYCNVYKTDCLAFVSGSCVSFWKCEMTD